jgi:integrase
MIPGNAFLIVVQLPVDINEKVSFEVIPQPVIIRQRRLFMTTKKPTCKKILTLKTLDKQFMNKSDINLEHRIFNTLENHFYAYKWVKRLPGDNIPFSQMIDKYLKEYSLPNKSHKTFLREKSLTSHLLDVFRDRPITEITPKEVSEYLIMRSKCGASPRQINYELMLLRHVLRIAQIEWEWIESNPAQFIRRKHVQNIIERWLTIEEEKRLSKCSPEWLRDIIIFAIHTGFRRSEIIDLTWSQIDFQRRTITITKQKNNCIDTVPINETVVCLLKKRLDSKIIGTELVFPSQVGTKRDGMNLLRSFHLARSKAGIEKLRFHDLRHTFATRLVQKGVDLYTVQKLGRWRSTAMIMRYAHHNAESLRPGIETMDDKTKKKDNNVSMNDIEELKKNSRIRISIRFPNMVRNCNLLIWF